jgi:diguanylate cyclase (GGDEF)-like protein
MRLPFRMGARPHAAGGRVPDPAFAALAEAHGGLVLLVDDDGLIDWVSPAAAPLLGIAPEALAGTPFLDLVHPEDVLAHTETQRFARRGSGWLPLHVERHATHDRRGRPLMVVVARRLEAADRFAAAVATEREPLELFAVVAEEAGLTLGTDVAAVVRFERTGEGTVVGCWEAEDAQAPAPGTRLALDGPSAAATVFRTGQPARVEDERELGHAAPIRVADRLWGALVLAVRADAAGALPADVADRLAALARVAAAPLAWADASLQLSALSTRDALTGLPDARAFHDQLRAEVLRARRHERPLSIVLLDVDDFRRLNATYGRLACDRALTEAARRLSGETRQGEHVARLGGNRFGWILPETDGLDAWVAAERARKALSATPYPGLGGITASAGVCDLLDAADGDELVALADVALLHAKRNGRNVTFRYSPELRREAATPRPEDARLQKLSELARDLEAEDPGSEGHSERVARLAEKLALAAGWPLDRAVRLGRVALVHDVGMLGIDGAVLRKPGRLTSTERRTIEEHVEAGVRLAGAALDEEQLLWLRHHHERWDGRGYPDSLVEEEIPDGARLLAVAEAWDAMTSEHSYAGALAPAAAMEEVRLLSGRQFAPDAVLALERLWRLGALTALDVEDA